MEPLHHNRTGYINTNYVGTNQKGTRLACCTSLSEQTDLIYLYLWFILTMLSRKHIEGSSHWVTTLMCWGGLCVFWSLGEPCCAVSSHWVTTLMCWGGLCMFWSLGDPCCAVSSHWVTTLMCWGGLCVFWSLGELCCAGAIHFWNWCWPPVKN
jgi:hypothetical protein